MQPGRRLDHIHGLRGIAALAVVVQHAAQIVNDAGNRFYAPLLETINLGRFGVVLFFLISGLVIPFSFHGPRPLRGFVISRCFRLYPAYWLSIPLMLAILQVRGVEPAASTVLGNVTMFQGFWVGTNLGYGYWTLNLEVFFYVACAVMFARGLLKDVNLNALLIVLGLVVGTVPYAIQAANGGQGFASESPFFLALFFLGMMLRRVFVDECPRAKAWSLALVPAALFAGVVLSGVFFAVPENGNEYLTPLALTTSMTLPVIVFLLVLKYRPRPSRVLMFLGTVSYSAYLFQDFALVFLPKVMPPGASAIGFCAAALAITVGLATVIYYAAEKPMIEVGRRLIRRGAPAGETVASPA